MFVCVWGGGLEVGRLSKRKLHSRVWDALFKPRTPSLIYAMWDLALEFRASVMTS